MRTLLCALLLTARLSACSCFGSGTPCSDVRASTAVFVARILVDGGEGWGTRPARVLVEERLFNTPENLRETEIDIGARGSCYFRVQNGKRYVLFADIAAGPPIRLSVGGCSHSFVVEGNEHILDALRNKASGGPSRIIGPVEQTKDALWNSVLLSGAIITATSAAAAFEAVSGETGIYEMHDVPPGVYQINISKPGFVPDAEYNRRPASRHCSFR